MRTTAARLLRQDQLLVAPDAVYETAKVEYPIPLNLVSVELTDQMTAEGSTRDFRWDQLLSTEEPYEVKIGDTAKVTVELALLSDADRSHVYREAAQTLLDFLSAAGTGYGSKLGGRDANTGDMFPPAVEAWAYLTSDDIATAAIGLSEGREAGR